MPAHILYNSNPINIIFTLNLQAGQLLICFPKRLIHLESQWNLCPGSFLQLLIDDKIFTKLDNLRLQFNNFIDDFVFVFSGHSDLCGTRDMTHITHLIPVTEFSTAINSKKKNFFKLKIKSTKTPTCYPVNNISTVHQIKHSKLEKMKNMGYLDRYNSSIVQ